MIDVARYLAPGSLLKYRSAYNSIRSFTDAFDVPFQFVATRPSHPAFDRSIILAWACLYKIGVPSSLARKGHVTLKTPQSMRSALSAFDEFQLAVLDPSAYYRTGRQSLRSNLHVPSSGNLASTFLFKGLGRRLGLDVQKTQCLTLPILKDIIHLRRQAFLRSRDPVHRYHMVAATCLEMSGVFGWLRSNEAFSLQRQDVDVVAPGLPAQRRGLLRHIGMIGLRLLPSTKNSQTRQADVMFTWVTGSGIAIGPWFQLLFTCLDELGYTQPSQLLFVDGIRNFPWRSGHYRTYYLFPMLLQLQRSHPFLAKFDNSTPELTFAYAFNDFSLWKRTGETHCAVKRPGCTRAIRRVPEKAWATRWRIKDMDKESISAGVYQNPTDDDRLDLTRDCF